MSLGVYDAAYPGGTTVVQVGANGTGYLRIRVSDPFGAYDVSGVDLTVTSPLGTQSTVSLSDANVVATGTAFKIYEYAWHPGSTTGTFNFTATAHEGTEGLTDVATMSVTVPAIDLGITKPIRPIRSAWVNR